MNQKPVADVIQTQYVLLRHPNMFRLEMSDRHGNRWRTNQDGIYTLGRRVAAYTIDPTTIAELDRKERLPYRETLRYNTQANMQAWADRSANQMHRRYGNDDTKLVSEFASRRAEAQRNQRLVSIAGFVACDLMHINFSVAEALRKAEVGDFRVKINTDSLPSRPNRQDEFGIFGIGEGNGADTGGAWTPFYDVRTQAIETYERARDDGASFHEALSTIAFTKLASAFPKQSV